jgi:hypothetical protein
MMHPNRMPAISLGIILRLGTVYDASHHWRTDAGDLRASLGFDAGGYSNAHIQGPPAALRELAAALVEAADRADSSAVPAPAVAEGWRADVGRPPARGGRLPGVCNRLAHPLQLA